MSLETSPVDEPVFISSPFLTRSPPETLSLVGGGAQGSKNLDFGDYILLGSCDIVKDVISYLFWSWASYRRLTTLCFKLVPFRKSMARNFVSYCVLRAD